MRAFKAKRFLGLVLCLVLGMGTFATAAACGEKGNNSSSSSSEAPADTEYTVTFVTDGGTEIDPMQVEANTNLERPDNPTKAGHIFKGWYLDLNNIEAGSFLFDETPITSDITLYALWQIRQYNVSYQDSDGNPVEGLTGGVYDWGSTLEKPDETNIAKEGYIVKWYTAAGEIWDFETSKVISNTVLTYLYVTTKDSYNAAEIAENFYPVLDKTLTDPEKCQEHYTEGAETVFYTYATTNLQQVVLNVELATLDYASVTVIARTTDVENLDYTKGGDFAQLRAYIKTDVGGNVSYNDEPSSGYNPLYYYIQSTGTNKELFSSESVEDGFTAFTFDLASLKFWNEATRLDSFAFGFVSTTKGIEIKSIVFNKVDKEQEFTVAFEDNLGNEVAAPQSVKWNTLATKPAAPASDDVRKYTGEWIDAMGEVFDFENTNIRSNVTLYPQYTVEGKYSWTGTEVAQDFRAVYNANLALLAGEEVVGDRSIFTYNGGAAGNSLEQISIDNLNLTIGEYKYLTFKWRTVNFADYTYAADGAFALIRLYVVTDKGGSALKNNLEDADKYYLNFNNISASETTTPVDMSAKYEDGWYVVTADLSALPYFAEGTTLYGLTIGTTTGQQVKAIEVAEIALVTELATNDACTVTFTDDEGNAIEGLDAQTVPYGKAVAVPNASLVPAKGEYVFSHWVDAEGNEYKFGGALTQSITLKAAYTNSWEGETYKFSGQGIVDNFTSSSERYGNTVEKQHNLTLVEGNAVGEYTAATSHNGAAAANKVITMLNAGIRVHEGSKMVVTFKSSAFAEGYTYTQFKMGVAFKGEDPATTIFNNAATPHYFQYTKIAAGTLEGSSDTAFISFKVAEDGMVTVTCDLYAMSQASLATVGEGVDVTYVDAFSLMIVETNNATTATKNECTITYYSVEFIDVQMEIKETPEDPSALKTITYSGQQIVDAFTTSYERYGNTLEAQNKLTLVEGNATGDYTTTVKPNKTLTMLNAGIQVFEGSKLIVTFKSSSFAADCTVNRLNLGVAFRGEDPATTIKNKAANAHYFQYKDIPAGTTEGTDGSYVSFTVAADGTVTATFDLYAISQASAGAVAEGVDVNYIDAFTFMFVEGNGSPATNASTLTYYSIQFVNIQQNVL